MIRLIAISFCLLVSYPAFALDPFLWEPRPEDPRAYASVARENRGALEVYDYARVFAALGREAEQSEPLKSADPVRERLLKAIAVLNGRFVEFERELVAAERADLAVDRFLAQYPTGLFQFPCPDGTCLKDDYVVTYDELSRLPDAPAEDFLYRIATFNRLLNDFKQPATKFSVTAIQRAERRWETYLRDGMSQFPWEAAFNAWTIGADDIQRPPGRQWILLHPSLAVEMSTDGIKDLRAKQALALELVGHVWYSWRDDLYLGERLHYWGVSALATLRDDLRPGLGFMAHYGRLVMLGVTWHDVDQDDDWFDEPPYLTLGIDLFRFAADRAPAYQQKLQRAAALRDRYFGQGGGR